LIDKNIITFKKICRIFKAELVDNQDTLVYSYKNHHHNALKQLQKQLPEHFITTHNNETITLTLCHDPF